MSSCTEIIASLKDAPFAILRLTYPFIIGSTSGLAKKVSSILLCVSARQLLIPEAPIFCAPFTPEAPAAPAADALPISSMFSAVKKLPSCSCSRSL